MEETGSVGIISSRPLAVTLDSSSPYPYRPSSTASPSFSLAALTPAGKLREPSAEMTPSSGPIMAVSATSAVTASHSVAATRVNSEEAQQPQQPQAPTPPAEQDEAKSAHKTSTRPLTFPTDHLAGMTGGDESAQGPHLVVVAASADADLPIRNLNTNGNKQREIQEHEVESELSDPDSNVNSPPSATDLAELDEIVVGARTNSESKVPSSHVPSEVGDQAMDEAIPVSPSAAHYPKRKRTSLDNSFKAVVSMSDMSRTLDETLSSEDVKSTPNRQSLSGVKGVLLGVWRDSLVPELSRKHVVTGFIDVRDRLRTRIQPQTMEGESLIEEYPLPPGPGGSWVTFDRVIFSPHLVGLDQVMVKEYTRIRAQMPTEETEEQRKQAEADAVNEAIRRMKTNHSMETPTSVPLTAHGPELPEHMAGTSRPDAKRRKTLNFPPINGRRKSPSEQPLAPADILRSHTPQPLTSHQTRFSMDPLPGTRPTRILLGYWRPSSEVNPRDRHAVYGILGQNDMFRVKIVRETRDGRFVDGNYPTGAGALWIPYEEVEFEDHLKTLSRGEVKEYCRIRQYQLDNGETEDMKIENETKAVYEAQTRVGSSVRVPASAGVPAFASSRMIDVEMHDGPGSRTGYGGHELRQSRRLEPRPERPDRTVMRHSMGGNEPDMRSLPRMQGLDAVERTSALARREIARVEAAQGRADRHAQTRERAAAAAADAVSAAAAAAAASMLSPQQPLPMQQHAPMQPPPMQPPPMQPPPQTNGRSLYESEDMQRLNKVWARQELLRVKATSDDAKIYGGVKYERKANGPFVGKLVSQGTIINIDGEDYVEYRVLTKPSFF